MGSLVNLGDVSKPVNTLIEKLHEAGVGLFRPLQIERVAKAEAKAALIKAKSDIQINELQQRVLYRLVEEETNKQKNMEDIVKLAEPKVSETADPGKMDNDWIVNFFEKSRIISDADMQQLWAKILAGEANNPGSFSRRTINLLNDIDKEDASLFTKLLGCAWCVHEFTPLIFDFRDEIYTNQGIDFSQLNHLDTIGLISFSPMSGYVMQNVQGELNAEYFNDQLLLAVPEKFEKRPNGKNIKTGSVLLTNEGRQLAELCDRQPIDGFFDYVKDKWKDYVLYSEN
ncbi:MAG TPA: hypothetical protein DEB25_01470 [Desulfobulbaceae bacterium]|nr:hypothetical protein [Desulfobulbaceae bacterium]